MQAVITTQLVHLHQLYSQDIEGASKKRDLRDLSHLLTRLSIKVSLQTRTEIGHCAKIIGFGQATFLLHITGNWQVKERS